MIVSIELSQYGAGHVEPALADDALLRVVVGVEHAFRGTSNGAVLYRIPPQPRLSPAQKPVTQIKRLTPLASTRIDEDSPGGRKIDMFR